jgi:hypothetical protein
MLVAEDSKIKTYQENNNNFELIKYKGDDFYGSLDYNTYWEWWRKITNFDNESDSVSFCVITDTKELDLSINVELSDQNNIKSIEVEKFIKQNFSGQYEFYQENRVIISSKRTFSNARFNSKEYYINFFPLKEITKTQITDSEKFSHYNSHENNSDLYDFYKKKTQDYNDIT